MKIQTRKKTSNSQGGMHERATIESRRTGYMIAHKSDELRGIKPRLYALHPAGMWAGVRAK